MNLVAKQSRERALRSIEANRHEGTGEESHSAGDVFSRWYLHPVVRWFAGCAQGTPLRPNHLTLLGLSASMGAGVLLLAGPAYLPLAALPLWVALFCDHADGALARSQGSSSRWGAWLDANVDELADFGLHAAAAWAVIGQTGQTWVAALLLAFFAGKYLFMYGLHTEPRGQHSQASKRSRRPALGGLRAAYHLPANADVRAHLLIAAVLLAAWNLHALTVELAWTACYYNARWMLRYGLVFAKLGTTEGGTA